jgi:peptidyl-prolyl cis-trans isomerase SurA
MANYKKISLAIFIAVISFTATAQQNVIDQIVATIGRNIVLKSEVESQYFQLLSQGETPSSELQCNVLEELLAQKLMLEQAAIDSVTVSDEQVNSEIDRRLRYFVQQLGSEEKLEEYYQKSIAEIKDDFKDVIEQQLLIQRMQQTITGDITVSPAEVKEFYANFDKDSLPLIPEEVEINQIVIKPTVTKDEKEATKARLLEYKDRIEKGEDFETLALLYSDDPGSAANGGELGFLGRGVLVPIFEQVAFALQPNELSDIVETQFGYHLIQGISRKGEQVNVRHILLKNKVSSNSLERAQNLVDSISKLITENDSITFGTAVKQFSEDEDTKNSGGTIVNQQSGTTKFPLQQLDAQISLAIDELTVGEVSNPFVHTEKDGTQTFKIVQLKNRLKAHKANLEDDYIRIQEVTLANKKNKELENWVRESKTESHIEIKSEIFGCEVSELWKTSKTN